MVSDNLTQEFVRISQRYVNEELSQILSEVWNKISIILGGSICFGGADKFSDIDLFVIASGDELKKSLPINTQYENKRMGVDTGYSWQEMEGYLKSPPTDAESLFGTIQKAIILHDPDNRYKVIQEKINQYLPDDFWKKKLLKKWFDVFYTSDNGVLKALKREDPITTQIWKGELLQAIMELTFLLNRQYIPSKKWLYLNFCELPVLAKELEAYLKKIIEITNAEDMAATSRAIWDIFNLFIKEKKLLPPEVVDKPWKFV